MFQLPDISRIVAAALAEDLGVDPQWFLPGEPPHPEVLERDVTSSSVVDADAFFRGRITAREECVVAGLPVAAAVFDALGQAAGVFDGVEMMPLVAEGSRVQAGTALAEVEGLALVVLAAERTALDFMMLLSGIATETARWVQAAGSDLTVCDTRKTAPGLRALSKYAVTVGGGHNHRQGLHDMVLVKDNHLRHATIPEAVTRARSAHLGLTIQVEADTPEQALAAVEAGADMVLLDNMDDGTLAAVAARCREAAVRRGRAVLLEASGNVTVSRLETLSTTGVDRVSSSALTLARPVDIALDEA